MIIGLTGGIGAGKSMVSRILRIRGYHVYDCDYEARLIMNRSSEIRDKISAYLGAQCIDPEGGLDRKEIAKCVFGNEQNRLWLNQLIHSRVTDDILVLKEKMGDVVWFVESAILKTSRLVNICDWVWLVEAPEEIRLRRACDRDDVDDSIIRSRMEAQKGEFEFNPNIRVSKINNDGDCSLLAQIRNLLIQI